jgi:hypothetical protein
MTNAAIRRTAGALVAASSSRSAGPYPSHQHADPVYHQKFIDYLDKKGVPYKNRTEINPGRPRTHPGGISTYCTQLWG